MTTEPTIQRPSNIAFRPVKSAEPVTVNLPAVKETPALDLLKANKSTSLQIDCREAIGPELAKAARDTVYNGTMYEELCNNPVAVRQLGNDTLEHTNRVINELFEKENFSNLTDAANLLRSLRKDMRKLTEKYNPGDPKVLAFYQKWQPSIFDKLKGIKTIGQLIMIDVQPLKSQMKAVEKESRSRLKTLDDTLAYYTTMQQLAEDEVQNLMYVIAVMEYILERAKAELENMPEHDSTDPFNNKRDRLGRFINDMDTKVTDFKAKLWLDAANAPRIMEMSHITQSVALRMVTVINLVIPSMKQAITDWNKTASTVEAARFIQEVTTTFNEVVQKSNEATAAAVPIMLSATQTPMLSVESVYSFAKMYDNLVTAIDTELALGDEKRKELRQAQAEVLGKIIDDKAHITESYVRSALQTGEATVDSSELVSANDLHVSAPVSTEDTSE